MPLSQFYDQIANLGLYRSLRNATKKLVCNDRPAFPPDQYRLTALERHCQS